MGDVKKMSGLLAREFSLMGCEVDCSGGLRAMSLHFAAHGADVVQFELLKAFWFVGSREKMTGSEVEELSLIAMQVKDSLGLITKVNEKRILLEDLMEFGTPEGGRRGFSSVYNLEG